MECVTFFKRIVSEFQGFYENRNHETHDKHRINIR